jgi:hypothetical protein
MVLPSAPSSIAANQINTELGFSSTTPMSIDGAQYRSLAQVPTPSSTIAYSNFYGKSANFGKLGECYCGGYWQGCTTVGPSNYYIVIAPQPAGTVKGIVWRIPAIPIVCCTPQTNNQPDGYFVTKLYNNSNYPLMQWANGLSINGYSDWYVPAYTEASTSFTNNVYIETFGYTGAANAGQQANCHTSYTLPCMQTCFPYLGWPAAMPAITNGPAAIGGPVTSTEYPTNPCGVNILAIQDTRARWGTPFNQAAGCLYGKLNTTVFTRAFRRIPF